MGKLMDRLMALVGYQEGAEEYEEAATDQDLPEPQGFRAHDPHETRRRARLVNFPSQPASPARVVICEIRHFEEVQTVADHLKNRRMVIASVVATDREEAKRAVDFLSGAVYALDGGVQKIGEGVFLFTPENVTVDNEHPLAQAQGHGIFA
ncbi:MAG: cell division protein SepF [Syntrophothermus sp.]